MFLRDNAVFVLLCVVLASPGTCTRFTLPREDYKLLTAIREVQCSSLVTCCALCKETDACLTVSYKASEGRCLLGTVGVTHDRHVGKYLETEHGWVTMSKVHFTVYNRLSPAGLYKATFADAVSLCAEDGRVIASPEDILVSKSRGLRHCVCGWLSNRRIGFVLQTREPECWPTFSTNIIYCNNYIKADAWCKL